MGPDSAVATTSSARRVSLIAGVLYLLTFVSLPSIALYRSVKGTNYVLGTGPDTPAIVGGLLEIVVALAGIATAVVLFPLLRRQNEAHHNPGCSRGLNPPVSRRQRAM